MSNHVPAFTPGGMRIIVLLAAGLLPAVASADGAATFSQQCAQCHGKDAKGMAYVAPPLVGSEWLLQASVEEVMAMIRTGRQGDAKRFPKEYPAAMPPFTEAQISGEALDDLVTYLKGNLQE